MTTATPTASTCISLILIQDLVESDREVSFLLRAVARHAVAELAEWRFRCSVRPP